MLNIGIITDFNWDNFILVNNKLKKINKELFRIHSIYCKSLELINNCCCKNNLVLYRHFSEDLCKTCYNLLKICDIWIIFTNYTEYNNPPTLIIEKCNEYNIKYIVVSEFSRENDYYSFNNNGLTFKKFLLTLEIERPNILPFTLQIYNDIFISKRYVHLNLTQDIRNKIKSSFNLQLKQKQDRCIKLLYNTDDLKQEKQIKKTMKEINQIDFTTNRMNYYKKIN